MWENPGQDRILEAEMHQRICQGCEGEVEMKGMGAEAQAAFRLHTNGDAMLLTPPNEGEGRCFVIRIINQWWWVGGHAFRLTEDAFQTGP